MSFNRHRPRAIIFGPIKYQGKGLATFSVLQYTLHLERFIGYLRHQNHEGNLLRIQMNQHQQLIGSEAHFLSLPSTNYPYGEEIRVQFLWDNNTKWGITLQVQGAWRHHMQRENDKSLMDGIVAVIKNPLHLRRINDVKLFLKVGLLSDITTLDGSSFLPWTWVGPPRVTNEKWPNRRVPLPENWKLWRHALCLAFYGASGLYPSYLRSPLASTFHHQLLLGQPSTAVQSTLSHLKAEYKAILGDLNISDTQVSHVVSLLKSNSLYCGNDGSEKCGLGSYAHGFTSGKAIEHIWEGA